MIWHQHVCFDSHRKMPRQGKNPLDYRFAERIGVKFIPIDLAEKMSSVPGDDGHKISAGLRVIEFLQADRPPVVVWVEGHFGVAGEKQIVVKQ